MKKNFLRRIAFLMTLVMLLTSLSGFADTEPDSAEYPAEPEMVETAEAPEETVITEATEDVGKDEKAGETEVTGEPEAPEEPEESEESEETEETEDTEAIEETEVTEESGDSEAPEVTGEGEASEEPELSEEPEESGEIDEPEAADEPEESEETEESGEAEATAEPDAAEEADVSEISDEMSADDEKGEKNNAPVNNSTDLADGVYTPEAFSFSGGSGKVTFTCPQVTVSGGRATAMLAISSTSYPYFRVGGAEYATKAYEGGGMFAEVPAALNAAMPVYAYSEKMATEIEYSVTITLTGSGTVETPGEEESGEEGGATEDEELADGEYETGIESDFSMFKITSQSATVKGGVVTVTIGTSKNTYDKFHFGTYADRDESGSYAEYVQGVKKEGEDGYTFTFTLPKDNMGKSVPFVPGKPDGSWYEGKGFTNQYYMKIPSALGSVIAPDDGDEEDGSGVADGDYTANAEAWVGFKLKSTRIKVHGDSMTVTLISGQMTYDAIYIGSVDDADKSDVIQGKLVNGNSAFEFTFELPVSALGTKVLFAIREYKSSAWSKYQQSLTLPAALDAAVPEQDVDINDYADGEYTGETTTYTKTEINGEEAYNNNAAFAPSGTKILVSGDEITVTFTCNSAEKVHYPYLYLGSKADAANAPESEMITCYTTPSSVAGGIIPHYTFTLPRSALGKMLTFSGYSTTNEVWYEYTMLISDKLTAGQDGSEKPDNPGEGETVVPGDGDYSVNVESSASMFKVVSCVLTAKDGKYSARIALSGTGYDKLYMGTAEAAANAAEGEMIGYTVNADGMYEFTVPVSALDMPIAVAAHSIKNDKWYDRELTFKSEGMQKFQPSFSDGDYSTSVETGESMFKVVACTIAVKNGQYTAKVTLSGTGYDKLYMGTAEAAANAEEGEMIGYTVSADGKYEFTVPVSALDVPIAVASHALKSDKWYDRTMTFSSENMQKLENGETPDPEIPDSETPEDGDDAPDEPEKKPESDTSGSTSSVDSSTSLADGTYAPDRFSWSGGSGRVSLSCSKVTVKNGKAVATIVFNSPNYSYVKANGQKIYGSHTGSTSVFQVPVELNANNRILGMTTKMTADHEIAYTVYIYIAGAKDSAASAGEEQEAEMIGLTYASSDAIDSSALFRIYRYEDGFAAIDVADVGRYLLVPEGAEVPVGMDEDAVLIQMPVQSAYVAADFALEMVEGLKNEEITKVITSVGVDTGAYPSVQQGVEDGSIVHAGECSELDYAALLKTSCDIVILPETFAVEAGEDVPVETEAMIAEVSERLSMLGIPAFVDRSADEETEAGRLEWIKVYGLIFGCETEANALYEQMKAELSETPAAA